MISGRSWLAAVAGVAAAAAVGATLAPQAVPFLVNSVTEGNQREPSLAADGAGVTLIAWDSDGAALDETEIAGRLVTSDGTPTGDEFQINSHTANSQIRPAVAGFRSGGFVVAWESYIVDTDEDEIFVRRFDAAGNPLGTETRIDDSEFHLHVDVAEVGSGGFVVVWDDGLDLFGRTFDANGDPADDGFRINEQPGTMYGPRVASDSSGAFTVVWEDRSEIDGDGSGVLMRRFDASGAATTGDLQVNTSTIGDQYAPTIGMRGDGSFIVAWEAYGQQSEGDGAFARLYAADGTSLGGDFRVDDGNSVYAGYVDAAGSESDFVVVWNEPRDEGSDTLTTRARRVRSDGSLLNVVDIDPEEQGDQANAVVSAGSRGVVVAWEGFGPDEQDIFAQHFDEIDAPEGCPGDCDGNGVVTVSELVRGVNIALGTLDLLQCPAVDLNGDGTVAINELIAAVNAALAGCG